MKSLAYIGAFALGAIAGGWATLSLFTFGVENRIEHPVDDEALFYEDEDFKVVRVNKKNEGDKVAIAVIIHKD